MADEAIRQTVVCLKGRKMTPRGRGRTNNDKSGTIMAANAQNWPNLIFEKLREFDVRHVTYVPDSGHARLIELCHAADDMKPTLLTTEEEGIGVLAGAWLGGERGVLLMQSAASETASIRCRS